MKRLVTVMSLLSIFGLTKAADYSEGQVWSYKTRVGEGDSIVLINKVEIDENLGKIFHISVEGLRVKNRHIDGGISTELPHLPVSEETLKKSLIEQIGKREPNLNYIEGYRAWREAFDAGNAGVFSIAVAEIIAFVQETINIGVSHG